VQTDPKPLVRIKTQAISSETISSNNHEELTEIQDKLDKLHHHVLCLDTAFYSMMKKTRLIDHAALKILDGRAITLA